MREHCERRLSNVTGGDCPGIDEEIAKNTSRTWCSYCGFEVEIDDDAATKISAHIAVCEKHPIFALRARVAALEGVVEAARSTDQVLCDAMTFYAPDMSGDEVDKARARATSHGGVLAYIARARKDIQDALASLPPQGAPYKQPVTYSRE